ncbi:MAG: PD-(D/E)XK nuclease family protein [Candidatus Scalindua sp.]|nr:PD-(D/E)XK nuclease family protein [Candidatus Scalindua sp.]
MSKFYTPKRSRNIFDPKGQKPFKLSRSKIDLFLECPRCFYIDRRLGVGRVPGFPFNLNSAVDTLLKKEFDYYRVNNQQHPLLEKYGVDARPASHKDLEKWRHNFTGIQYLHEPTNLLLFGAIDDLWINTQNEYIVVDYKATSKNEKITHVNLGWQIGYRRQMEIYQWLLRKNDYSVSSTGYFVYCNGQTDREKLNGKLEFDITLIHYNGDDSWVAETISKIHDCLSSNQIPDGKEGCDFCAYRKAVAGVLKPDQTLFDFCESKKKEL